MKKNKKFITFGAPYIGEEEINDVINVLKSGWLGTGPKVQEFQKNFKDYKNSFNAAATEYSINLPFA